MFLKKIWKFRRCNFAFWILSTLGKRHESSFVQTWIPFTQGCFVSSIVIEKEMSMWKVKRQTEGRRKRSLELSAQVSLNGSYVLHPVSVLSSDGWHLHVPIKLRRCVYTEEKMYFLKCFNRTWYQTYLFWGGYKRKFNVQ